MKIKFKRNVGLLIGLILAIIGMIAMENSSSIISKYSGPGINLNEVNPQKAFLVDLHLFIGMPLFLFGIFLAIFGIIQKSLYKIVVNKKKLKKIGAIKLLNKSHKLNKDIVQNNILKSNYKLTHNNIFIKIHHGIAQILIFEKILDNQLTELITQLKKEDYFTFAIIINLSFIENLTEEDLITLNQSEGNSFNQATGYYLLNGIISNNYLFIDAKLFTRTISNRISAFYIYDILKNIKGKTRIKEKTDKNFNYKKNIISQL